MQRDIKFRGLRVDGKGWVYGYYWYDNQNKKHKITVDLPDDNFRCYEVMPESVGQLIANNGIQDFYIGDIVVNPQGRIHTVVIFDNCPCLHYIDKGRDYYLPMTSGYLKNKKVTGNIHEQK